jgi:hypothetical protein
MQTLNEHILLIIADLKQGKAYETELGNYAAGTRSKINIKQNPDNLQFIVTEIEQDAYSLDEWTKTQNLSNVSELTLFLNKILNH